MKKLRYYFSEHVISIYSYCNIYRPQEQVPPEGQIKKRRPNRLTVDDAPNSDDSTIVVISTETMNRLEVFKGDIVLLKGKRRAETACVAINDDNCPPGTIRMNRVTRTNLKVKPGDIITATPCPETKFGKHVLILPFDDSIEGITGNLFDVYLKPFFSEAYRPVHEGM